MNRSRKSRAGSLRSITSTPGPVILNVMRLGACFEMSDVVRKAADFARAAHEGIDQRRHYTNEPYIVHPQAVAEIVATVTEDESILAAAWLHDVVEDTPIESVEIAKAFGPDIARLVADLTNPSTSADGNRNRRKQIDREHTAQADARAKTIKLADLIDNLSGIAKLNPGFAKTYLKEKELQLQVLEGGLPELFERAKQIINDEKAQLSERNL